MLLEYPHRVIRSSDERIDRLRRKYFKYRREHAGKKPIYYRNRDRWSALPREFLR